MGAVHGHGCCPSHPRSGRTSLQGLTVMMRFQQAAATTTTTCCLDPPRQRQPGEEATKRSGVNSQSQQADPAQPGPPLSSRDADSPSGWQKPPACPAPVLQARGAKLWDENPAAHQVKPCQAEWLHFCAFQGFRTPKQPTATSRTGQGPETAQASWGQTPQAAPHRPTRSSPSQTWETGCLHRVAGKGRWLSPREGPPQPSIGSLEDTDPEGGGRRPKAELPACSGERRDKPCPWRLALV